MTHKKTALLLILDGWGHREETASNAIHAANSPNWDKLWREQPHTLITTSGKSVGLPAGQMGNSEVGHMNLGAGRVVYQSLTRIDKGYRGRRLLHKPCSATACRTQRTMDSESPLATSSACISGGGIHSHENQIIAMIELAIRNGAPKIFLHAFLDGRDTPPRSALPSLYERKKRY